jgi:hypothetical protein
MAASYDLNEVADALAAVWQGLDTGLELNGQALTLSAHSEVIGTVEVPALVLELDDINWDMTMGAGMDDVTFVATVLVEAQDLSTGQRQLRAFLSRDGGLGKIKRALEADQSLGGLVSYAHIPTVRRFGQIEYAGSSYLGVELTIEVVS